MFTLVACMTQDGTIGVNDSMPWSMPGDMKHFKMLTIGHRVVMGNTTFKGLNQPLQHRDNWVVSRTETGAKGLDGDSPVIYASPQRIISLFEHDEENVFVIGGRDVYELFMPHAKKMILTMLEHHYEVDEQPSLAYRHTFFPKFSNEQWTNVGCQNHKAMLGDDYNYSVHTLLRTAPDKVAI